MTISNSVARTNRAPVVSGPPGGGRTSREARAVLVWTFAISVLVTVASVLGLADQGMYAEETKNWTAQARGQDIGNLVAVVTLWVSGYRWSRGSHSGGLVWLGTLLYLVYAYVVYSMAVHFNGLFLVYVAVLGLSSYAAMFSIAGLRAEDERYPRSPHRRVAGFALIAIGVLFAALWLSELIPATLSGEVPESVAEAGLWVNPIHVIDLAWLLPAFVIAGYSALKGKTAGAFFVEPLLTFSVLMGSSIVAAMVLMTVEGFAGTVPPMVMVSLVVLLSLFTVWRDLSGSYVGARRGAAAG